MYTAWKHRVQLLFLPAHSSHITQPLDVGVFGPLKEYYRQQLAGLVDFVITSPLQKQRFIQAYKTAAESAFTTDNIKSGFRAAGIYPTNVERPLVSVIRPAANQARPVTPEGQETRPGSEWWTPRDSKEIDLQADLVRQEFQGVDRSVRRLAAKAGRALDHKNALVATLAAENKHLKAQLAAREPKGRKPVKKDPNEAFASMEEIKTARDAADRAGERLEARDAVKIESPEIPDAQRDARDVLFDMDIDLL